MRFQLIFLGLTATFGVACGSSTSNSTATSSGSGGDDGTGGAASVTVGNGGIGGRSVGGVGGSSAIGGAGGTNGTGGTGGDGGTGTGGAPPATCAGLPDFTPCQVVTNPDRTYDICIDEVCVSPGCGPASCNAPGPHFTLADTGQTTCYDTAGNTIACSPLATCATLCGQDGQVGWDANNVASARFTPTTDTVVDNVTGLIWTRCSAGQSGAACAGTASDLLWADALNYCDGLTLGGASDWRLPNEYELHSLIDHDRAAPGIDPAAFPNTPSERLISSSTYAGDTTGAWFPFWNGTGYWGVVLSKQNAVSTGKVRCVRDPAPPALPLLRRERSLAVNGEPTVIDHATGLEWQGCENGLSGNDCTTGSVTTLDWGAGLDHCHNLSWGGHQDWHLPDVKQLRSIMDNRRTNPGLDGTLFPNHQTFAGWTSTTNRDNTANAWVVTIGFGGGIQDALKSAATSIRCVRFN